MKYFPESAKVKSTHYNFDNSNYNRIHKKIDDENFQISSNCNNDINIYENYISENIGNSSYNMNNRSNYPFTSKLLDQLSRKRKERSSFYNFLLLTTFNLNISHFCFPYLLNHIGICQLIIILIICGFFSYLVHSGLIDFVSSNREISNLNYADLIEFHFGNFLAWVTEIGMILWLMYLMVNFYTTCKKNYKNFFQFIFDNEFF